MARSISALEQARAAYRPRVPGILQRGIAGLAIAEGRPTTAVRDTSQIRELFPMTFGRPELTLVEGSGPFERRALNVGVVLSGGQASGGHNVIAGLFDGLRAVDPQSRLYGFLWGPRGIVDEQYEELTAERIDAVRNTGGFDLIGSGRDKIETDQQLAACREVCRRLDLDGLVIVGGDDSNTNAAVLAENFLQHDLRTVVLGVPKTIDGDLKGHGVEISFGFDTATKVYSELIGNISRDAVSAGKYWHFIRLMGRHASHVTLEAALQVRPNIALIGEEARERKMTLDQVVEYVAEVIRRRSQAGKNYGVCLVPEGTVEFIPEIRLLIEELNRVLAEQAECFETLEQFADCQRFVNEKLSRDSSYVFSGLPQEIQRQLLLERDSHGNVPVSQIDTETLLIEKVASRIAEWKAEGRFDGRFQFQGHFFGYEGRSVAPSNFDADYTYSLGQVAAVLTAHGRTGYICAVRNLTSDPSTWEAAGVPLTSMMQIEVRHGRPTAVIGKALVDTAGRPFSTFCEARQRWETEDEYCYPGPIQYFGPDEVRYRPTETLRLENGA